jgi:hypothetical protein
MTEGEWDACTDPAVMLEALKAGRVTVERKSRLWSVACHRTCWRSNTEPCVRHMVDVAEALADGAASDADRVAAAVGLSPILRGRGLTTLKLVGMAAAHLAARLGITTTRVSIHANVAVTRGLLFAGDEMNVDQGKQMQIDLLRDIFGNPFRPPPTIPPHVLAWDGGLVVQMAMSIYEDRGLPSGHLDPDRLAVLADALTDAGCTDDRLLAHLRSPGPHVRGCVGVDEVLGRR